MLIYELTTSFQQSGILERNHLQVYLRDKINVISPNTLIYFRGIFRNGRKARGELIYWELEILIIYWILH
jgi:hypothetical protein